MSETKKAVIRDFYKWLYEMLGPSHNYPRAIQKLIFQKPHLNNKERFTLVVFFMVNGIDPQKFVQFMFTKFNFDQDATRQILYLVRKFPNSKWKAWNVALQKTTQ